MRLTRTIVAVAGGLALSCGGAGSITGSKIPTRLLSVGVFYDENGNGAPDAAERVHIPGARVSVGGATGQTDASGRAELSVPEGAQTVTVAESSLPPFFHAGSVAAAVPGSGTVFLPATLSLGSRIIPNKYMAFGDSLTYGTYETRLEALLSAYFGTAQVVDEGVSGTRSEAGAARIGDALAYARPAYALILYGTNDWNELACKDDRFPCYTIDSLRTMVRETKAIGSLPFLCTLPPVNVGFSEQAPLERDEWVSRIDALIRTMAQEEGAVVVDLQKAYLAAPDRKALFTDYVHPSSLGLTLMAQELFKSITQR